MPRQRRNFSGAEKTAILREHLIEKVPISEVCEKHGLQPTTASRPLAGHASGHQMAAGGRWMDGRPRTSGAR